MMRTQFEMSINAYAYDVQNADASMYILAQRFWLLVAASGWLPPHAYGKLDDRVRSQSGLSVTRDQVDGQYLLYERGKDLMPKVS